MDVCLRPTPTSPHACRPFACPEYPCCPDRSRADRRYCPCCRSGCPRRRGDGHERHAGRFHPGCSGGHRLTLQHAHGQEQFHAHRRDLRRGSGGHRAGQPARGAAAQPAVAEPDRRLPERPGEPDPRLPAAQPVAGLHAGAGERQTPQRQRLCQRCEWWRLSRPCLGRPRADSGGGHRPCGSAARWCLRHLRLRCHHRRGQRHPEVAGAGWRCLGGKRAEHRRRRYADQRARERRPAMG